MGEARERRVRGITSETAVRVRDTTSEGVRVRETMSEGDKRERVGERTQRVRDRTSERENDLAGEREGK